MIKKGRNMLSKEKYNDYPLHIVRSPACREADNPRGSTRYNAYKVDKEKKSGKVFMIINGHKFISPKQ
jgi:hypothetical protein